MQRFINICALFVSLLTVGNAEADIVSYYIGRDTRTTPFNAPAAVGGGAYPDNPNVGRLTLLFYHGDHYHGIGAYTYSGAATTPVLNDTNSNNRLPESSTNLPPITLRPGAGAWAGTFRTGLPGSAPQDEEYGHIKLRNAHWLSSEDPVTYNSSSGCWTGNFDDAHIHLELVSKSPGLNIAFGQTPANQLINPGDDWHVGDGNEMFSSTPTFWVSDSAAPGSNYYAEFRLTNLNDASMNSGRFFFDLRVVPEPATGLTLALRLLSLLGAQRRSAYL